MKSNNITKIIGGLVLLGLFSVPAQGFAALSSVQVGFPICSQSGGLNKQVPIICLTQSSKSDPIKLSKNQKIPLSWSTSGSNFDGYEIVVGNTMTKTWKRIYGREAYADKLFAPSVTSVLWQVPSLASDFVKTSRLSVGDINTSFYVAVNTVRKTDKKDAAGNTVYDVVTSSNPLFFTYNLGEDTDAYITILKPEASDEITTDSNVKISWTYTNFKGSTARAYIDLLDDQGKLAKTIAKNISNSGSYTWKVDKNISAGKYQIRVYAKAGDKLIQDYSNGLFTIK